MMANSSNKYYMLKKMGSVFKFHLQFTLHTVVTFYNAQLFFFCLTDDCMDQPCVGNTTCRDGINSFTCVCPPSMTGQRCETYLSACANKPCRNGGVCLDDISGFRCFCEEGFTGLFVTVSTQTSFALLSESY